MSFVEQQLSEPPVATPRYHALDGLRALMMFLGIVLHGVLPYVASDMDVGMAIQDRGAADARYGLVVAFIHSFRMPVFFVMAGFFAALLRDRRGARGLLINRFRRIVVPFVVGWLIIFPLVAGNEHFFHVGGGVEGLRTVFNQFATGRLYANPNPSYLWFLYYLMMFYPAGLAASWLARRFAPHAREVFHRAFRHVLQSAVRPALFAILTALTLWPMSLGTLDTPDSFSPSPAILTAYFVFFGFGWLLHAHADLLPTFSRHAWKQAALALALFPLNVFAIVVLLQTWPDFDASARWLTIVTGALIVWLWVFGFTGLFLRYFDRPIFTMRYLTDSSYWCYLIHIPIIQWVVSLLTPVGLSSPMKILLTIGLTTAVALVTYHFGVRSTVIGEWLNGRRYPRGRAAVVSTPSARRDDPGLVTRQQTEQFRLSSEQV